MGKIIGDSENPQEMNDKYVIARINSLCVKELRELLDIKSPRQLKNWKH